MARQAYIIGWGLSGDRPSQVHMCLATHHIRRMDIIGSIEYYTRDVYIIGLIEYFGQGWIPSSRHRRMDVDVRRIGSIPGGPEVGGLGVM